MKYTKDVLQNAVNKSKSYAQVCRQLGAKPATGSQTYIKSRIVKYNIDTSHFLGRGHNKGKTFERVPLERYFSGELNITSHKLKLRLFRDGYKEKKCECCDITTWLGEEVPFHLDHINRNHLDNSLENLQILCPNCHSLKTRKDRAG